MLEQIHTATSILYPGTLDTLPLALGLLDLGPVLVIATLGHVVLVDTQNLGTLLGVVGTSKDDVHLLEHDTLSLGDEEVDKDGEDDVDAHEEEEAGKADLGEEGREELLEDGVGDVLALRGHTDGLGSNVGREDLAGPHPDGGTP